MKKRRSNPFPGEIRPTKRSSRCSSYVSKTRLPTSKEDCFFTWDPRSDQTPRNAPKRLRHPDDKARRVALRAAGGACLDCKRKKRKCEHVNLAMTSAFEDDKAVADHDTLVSVTVELKAQRSHLNVASTAAAECEDIQASPEPHLSVPSALHSKWTGNGTSSSPGAGGYSYNSLVATTSAAATKGTSVDSEEYAEELQFLADFGIDTDLLGSQFDTPVEKDDIYASLANYSEDESWISRFITFEPTFEGE